MKNPESRSQRFAELIPPFCSDSEADVARREALQNFEALRATQKEVTKSVGRIRQLNATPFLRRQRNSLRKRRAAANAADAEADRLARLLPNPWSSTRSGWRRG